MQRAQKAAAAMGVATRREFAHARNHGWARLARSDSAHTAATATASVMQRGTAFVTVVGREFTAILTDAPRQWQGCRAVEMAYAFQSLASASVPAAI